MNESRMGRRRRGFSLLELGAVVAILAILAVLILPRVLDRQADSAKVVDDANVKAHQMAADQYHLDIGKPCPNAKTLYTNKYVSTYPCVRSGQSGNKARIELSVVEGRAVAYWTDGDKPK